MASQTEAPIGLRRRWGLYALGALILIGLCVPILRIVWSADYAGQWGLIAAAVMGYQLWALWRALPQNYRAGQATVLKSFGPGNSLSLLRGVLIAMIAGFLFAPRPAGIWAWLPALLYFLADLADYFDGYLARRANHVTLLGETLDLNLDSLGVLVVVLLAYQYGTVPWWYLPVAVARYLFVAGIWLRERRGLPVNELQPSLARRVLAGFQMGFITAMLIPVFGPPATYLAATLFMMPFAAGFLYDWLQVSRAVGAPTEAQARLWARSWRFATKWLPLVLRATVVLILGARVRFTAFLNPNQIELYTTRGLQNAQAALLLFWLLEAALLVLIGLGVAGRISAGLGLLLLGVELQYNVLTLPYWALAVCFTGVLFLGPGNYALWKPEEKLHIRRGARVTQ